MIASLRYAKVSTQLGLGKNTVGRAINSTVRLFEDTRVSSTHCQLVWDGQVLRLCDLGSSHGTRVNGQKIIGPVRMNNGDIIMVGETELQVEIQSEDTPIESPTDVS